MRAPCCALDLGTCSGVQGQLVCWTVSSASEREGCCQRARMQHKPGDTQIHATTPLTSASGGVGWGGV